MTSRAQSDWVPTLYSHMNTHFETFVANVLSDVRRQSIIKHRKLSWLGHVFRHDTLPKAKQHVAVENEERSGHRRSTSTSRPVNHCRRCYASQMIEADGRLPAITMQSVRVLSMNDALASLGFNSRSILLCLYTDQCYEAAVTVIVL